MFTHTTQQGSNAERSRLRNRRAVLDQIRKAGTMGRAEIARALSLSTQAVSNIIADLTTEGLLTERGQVVSGRGLPAKQYALNAKGGFALGLEVRPDAVLGALLDLEGTALMTKRLSLESTGPEAVLKHVRRLQAEAIQSEPAAKTRTLGAGIVMPGPFGKTGITGNGSDLSGWQDIDPSALFSDALGLPVEVSNDANAAAMAERLNGVAQGLSNYAYLYFGAGLGLGLVSNGQLIQGAYGNAGEIGHIPMPGTNKNLESALSRLSVQTHMASKHKSANDFDALDTLFLNGDRDLNDWLEQASQALAMAVTIVENLFDPETIILGGAMPTAVLEHLVDNCVLPDQSVSNRPTTDAPRLQSGRTGRMTATLGAAALALNSSLSPHLAPTR